MTPTAVLVSLCERAVLGLCVCLLAVSSAPARAGWQSDLTSCETAGPNQQVCKQPLTQTDVKSQQEKLSDTDFAYEIQDDALIVSVRRKGPGDRLLLCCDIQAYLDPIAQDVYSAKIRWHSFDTVLLDLMIVGLDEPEKHRVTLKRSKTFSFADEDFDDAQLDQKALELDAGPVVGKRTLTVVTGRDCKTSIANCAIIYMPDGHAAPMLVANAVANGHAMSRFIVVGINGVDVDTANTRIKQLLHGIDTDYRAFIHFAMNDVTAAIEKGRTPAYRVVAGYSNGAAWALDVLRERPDLFKTAIVMSPARWKFKDQDHYNGRRIVIGAGLLETGFHSNAVKIAAEMAHRGASVKTVYVPAGHSMNTWVNVWNAAMADLER